MSNHYSRRLVVVVLLSLMFLAGGCTPRSTPPGPSSLTSSGSGFSFTYLKWDQGLRILFVDNVAGGHGSSSSGSTSDPVNHSKGYAGSEVGGYKWTCDSTNGTSATLKIDGKEYDLAGGTVFVVKVTDGKVDVHQLQRDMNAIPYDGDGCRKALQDDAEIQKILGGDAPKKQ